MEKRIELELRGQDPDKVKNLNLDNCRTSGNIHGLTDKFSNLLKLSMINVGLTSLKGFPKLPALKKLELADNRISSGLSVLKGSPELVSLNLSGNKIKDFEVVGELAQLKNLRVLDLFNCDVTQVEKYKDKVFELLPQLKYLDGFDRTGKEDPGDEDEDDLEDEDDEDALGEDEGESGEEEEDSDEEGVGLSAIYKSNLDEEDDEDDEDFAEGEGEEEDVDEEESDEEADGGEAEEKKQERGKKRKHEDEEEGPTKDVEASEKKGKN
ncbi:unnamed protein product [Cyprideis torosa]|uniref:Uncharacterized protein n=1 Tax=Cyprideis torosa TaxID=163714 RepID=A0A7R8W4C4_9CRUS|nr:unnamed protein product [Cyprideis torosa]CAG0884059.1 unnamed protein product [Cyprideis torosa]